MGRGSYLARTAGGTKSGGAGGDRGARLSRGSGSSGSSSNIQARKQAADTMKKANITGVGDTNKEKREERRLHNTEKKKLTKKHCKDVDQHCNRLQRYRVPFKLIEELLHHCS